MRYDELVNEGVETFYHGSKTPITKFTLDNVGRLEAIDQEGPGIYITSSSEDAKIYGDYVHILEVKVVKSRMLPKNRTFGPDLINRLIKSAPNIDDTLMDWAEEPLTALRQAVNTVYGSYGPNQYREAMVQVWYDFYREDPQSWIMRMRNNGWDGFIVDRAQDIKHMIVFNPDIITIKGLVT